MRRSIWIALSACCFSGCGSPDVCSRDSECTGGRVCEQSRCVSVEDRQREAERSAKAALEKELEKAIESVKNLPHGPTDDDVVDMEKRALLKAQLDAAQSAVAAAASGKAPSAKPSAKPKCKCDPSDPLCDCH